jgi:hypothetical protein
MPKIRNSLLAVLLIGLFLLTSGCFQVINRESGNTSFNNNPVATSASQNRFLWLLLGANSGERFGASVALFSDVDGAGHQGIAVGASAASPSNKESAGSVYIVSLLNAQALYRLDGRAAGDQFGRPLTTIGDLNNDKVSEFIVGAPAGYVEGLTNAGYVGLYSGKDGKMLDYFAGAAKDFRFGHSLAALGDINGDRIPDFAIGAPYASSAAKDNAGVVIIELSQNHPFNRQPLTVYGEASGDNFGWAVAGIGDVNGDQIADIAVGAPSVKSSGEINVGRVYILSGNGGAILYKIDGTEPGERLGFSLIGIGDINGDNVADLIAGAPTMDFPERNPPLLPSGSKDSSSGKVYVYSGRDGSLIYKLEGLAPGSLFGFSLASGDVNGDGTSDIIVGDPSALQSSGAIYVFSGRDGQSFYVFSNNPSRREEIGVALSSGCDLNGDGCADVIVGAYSAPNIEGKPTGAVYVPRIP